MKYLSLKLVLLGAVLFGYSQANAQFPESFDTAVAPTGWSTLEVGDLSQSWQLTATTNSGSGAAFIRYAAFTGLTSEDYLISPQFTPSAGDLLTFWEREAFGFDYGSEFSVRVSTTTNTAAGDFSATIWSRLENGSTSYSEQTVSLAAYVGTPIYLAFVSANDDGDSWYVDDVNVAPPPACPDPSDLAAISINSSGATLSWTDNASASAWDIELGTGGFTPSGTPTYNDVSNPYAYTTGAAATTYDYYVRADCGMDNVDVSNWVGPFSFTTACSAVSAPFSEDFNAAGSIPGCWAQGAGNSEDWIFSSTGGHVGDNGVLGGSSPSGGNFAYVDDSAPHDANTSLFTPFIDVSGLTIPELVFFYISNNEGNTNVDFDVDVWDGAAWNNVHSSNTNTAGGTWQEVIVNLTTLTITGDVQIRFTVDESNNGTDFYDDLAIDDVQIREQPACPNPSALSASSITSSGASLGWTDNASATAWDIEIGTAGFTPSGTPTYDDVTNPYTYADGAPTTAYEFYVRADCGMDNIDVSTWSGPFPFTTICATETPSYSEDFSTVVPMCWTINDVSGNADWGTNTNYDAGGSADFNLFFTGNDEYLISPNIDLSAGGYSVIVDVAMTDWNGSGPNEDGGMPTTDDFVEFLYSIDGGTTWTVITTWNAANSPDENGQIEVFDVSSVIANPAIFAFRANDGAVDDAADYDFHVADFLITNCLDVTDLSVDNVTDVSVDVTWGAALDPAETFTIDVQENFVSIGGIYPLSGVTGTSHSVSGLTEGTEYSVIVTPDCGGAPQEVPFATLNCDPTDPSVTCTYVLTCSDFGDGGGVEYDGWTGGQMVQVTAGEQVSFYNVPPMTYGGPQAIDFNILACAGDSLSFDFIGALPTDFESWSVTGPNGFSYQPNSPDEDITIISCPTCAPVTDVSVSNICENQVDVSWTNPAPYDSLEVTWNYFQPPFFFFGGTSGTITPGTATSTTLVATGPGTPWPLDLDIGYSVIAYCPDTGDGVEQSQVDGTFHTPACVCADQCYYALEGCDIFGDGWNGNQFNIVVDGVVVDSMIVDDPAGTIDDCMEGYIFNDTIYTCPGSLIEIVHIDGGFNDEVSFTVTSSIAGLVFTYDNIGQPEGGVQFSETTCPSCIAPTDLDAINLTGTSAQIVWSDPAAADDFDVAVELAGGTAAAGTYTNVIADTNFTATPLIPQTDYTAYVAANCVLGPSDTIAINFTTPCAAEVAPYTSGFENAGAMPNCWEQSSTAGGPWVFTGTSPGSPFCSAGLTPASGSYMAAIDMSGADTDVILTSPMVDVSALTVPQLAFMYNACNEDDGAINTIEVEAADGAGGWTTVTTINALTSGWELMTFDLTGFTFGAGLAQIRFRANDSTVGSPFVSDIHLDDFAIRETPNCPTPTSMAASNTTDNGADLAWSAGDSESIWDLHIVESGSAAPAEADPGNTPNLMATMYTYSGGMIATMYDVYYRAECGPADTSAWVGPVTFTTNSLSDNYCQGAGPTSADDSNLESVSITGDNGTSISYTAACPGPIGIVDETVTDTLELEAGVTYTMDVVVGTCGGSFGNSAEAWIDYDGSGTFDPSESVGSSDLTPTATETYTFTVPLTVANGLVTGMRVSQQETGTAPPLDPCASHSWGGMVDFAISITNNNPCPGNGSAAITIDSATEATLTWTEVGPATEWLVEGLNGPTQGTAGNDTTSVVSETISFTGLTGGTEYFAWIGSVCAGDTAWTPFSWTHPLVGTDCGLPIEIAGAPYTSGVLSTAGFGDDYSANQCGGNFMTGDDLVFRYSPAADICHSITFDAQTTWMGLHVLDGCPDDGATTCLVPDNTGPDFMQSGTGVRVLESFLFTGGQDYYFVVSTNATPQSGTFELSLGDCPDCIAPSNLSAHDIAGTEAKIGFESTVVAIDGTHAYSYAYGLNGFDIATESLGSGSDIVASDVQDTVALTGLMGSTTYQFCMWENCEALNPGDGQSDTVCVTFQTLITNDDCVDAAPISCDDIVSGFTTGAAPSTLGFFTGANEDAPDVWFTFTGANSDNPGALAGTAGDQVRLSTCNDGGLTPASATYDTKIDVYSSCTPASGADHVGGNDDGTDEGGEDCGGFSSNFSFATLVGTTYYVRVYGFNGGSAGNFDLQMTCEPPCLPVPSNDECANAETLALQVYGTAPATEGTNACASGETFNPSCDPFGVIQGVWYDFETHSSGETYFSLEVDPTSSLGNGAAAEIHYVIYSGDQCAATGVEQVCAEVDGDDPYSQVFISLEPDSVHQILVWSAEVEAGDFLIGVSGPPPPPVNDDATGAIALTVGTGKDCTSGTTGTLLSATQSADPLSGECGTQTNGYNDVWYTAIVPASGRVSIDFPSQPGANMFVELSTGTYPAITYVPLSCSAINPKIYPLPGVSSASALTPGETLYIRIWDAGNNDIGDFEICITDPVPANDNCADAVAAPVTDFGTGGWIEGRSDCAFEDGISCGTDEEVVWYSFEATDENMMINARPLPGIGSDYNAVIEVFDACGGSSLGCFDNYGAGAMERAIPGSLVAGNTYFYTVSHADGASDANSDSFETGVRKYNDGSLDPDDCDFLNYTLDDALYAVRDDLGDLYTNPAVPVLAYSFRFQEVGGGLDEIVDQADGIPYVNLEDVPGLEYGKTYNVSVRHRVRIGANGITDEYYSDFQDECVIGLGGSPATQLTDEFCNTVDHQLADQLFADPVTGADLYRFTFVGGGQTLIEHSSNYTIFLYNVEYNGESLLYQTAYDVTVQARVEGVWTPVGTVCSIGMGSPEDAEVQASYCMGSTFDFPDPNFILATQIYGADSYTWRFTPVGGGAAQETTTPGLSLAFHLTDLELTSGQWIVEVKVTAGGVTGDYTTQCTITINDVSGALAPPNGGDDIATKLNVTSSMNATVYPNPNTGDNMYVTLSEMTDENQVILIEVIDVTGKTIHSEQMVNKGTEANLVVDFDQPLSAGMYFINMTVNDEKVVEMLSVE